MKKIVFTIAILLMTGLASSAFITVDEGETGSANNTVETQAQPQSQNSQSFVSITGDTLRGALNMAGFGITGLPTPVEPQDAATKQYVDTVAGNGNSSSSIPGLEQVLSQNNVALSSIGFANGVMLGTGSSAESGGVAIGRNAKALAENSLALGKNAVADESGLAVIGSEENSMDLKVTGDLEVEGSSGTWTTSVNATSEGTHVNLTKIVSGDGYTVSATPVDSMERIGVFNKTSTGFDLRSTGETRVDIAVFH
jgi:hypothetical protein